MPQDTAKTTRKTSLEISEKARNCLKRIKKQFGLSQTAAIERGSELLEEKLKSSFAK